MREIKFRAWDNVNKNMELDVHHLDSLNEILHKDKYNAMQFTGLADKNGKDIYEGDHDENFDVVLWCDKRNGWAMKIFDFPTKEVISCHCYNCDGDFELYEIDNLEITGNIYETTTDKE